MESLIIVLFGFIAAGMAYVILQYIKKNAKLPPGPHGLPVIGSYLQMGSDPAPVVEAWSKKYGDTISVRLGVQTFVFLHDYDTAKAVMNNENTTGRNHQFIFHRLFHGKGLAATEGHLWREHRRFAISTLRSLGMGKSWFEDAILQEIAEFLSLCQKADSGAFYFQPALTLSVFNVVCSLVFGQRFEHSDKTFLRLTKLIVENLRLLNTMTAMQFLPFLEYIPFGKIRTAWKMYKHNVAGIQAIVSSLIAAHFVPASAEEFQGKGDYIHNYRKEQEKQKINGEKSTFTDEQLMLSIWNIFGAGVHTTLITLSWAYLYMASYPEIQQKVHEEIDNAIGKDRVVRWEDKAALKYTEAVLLEVQRLGSVARLGIAHMNFEAMDIDGYHIPPRTNIQINAYAMHRNPKYWDDPDVFLPERFIDGNGSIRIPKGFAPFGIGKRQCLGEELAKMELYLFFANVLQRHTIESPMNKPVSLDRFDATLVRSPLSYEICFVPR